MGMKNVAIDCGGNRIRVVVGSRRARTYRNAHAVTCVLVFGQLVFRVMKGMLGRLEVRMLPAYVFFNGTDVSLGGSGMLVRLL